MNTPTTIKQVLDKLTQSLQIVIIPKGGTPLVTTETTPTAPPPQAPPKTPEQ